MVISLTIKEEERFVILEQSSNLNKKNIKSICHNWQMLFCFYAIMI
jgi:hypothetical protein